MKTETPGTGRTKAREARRWRGRVGLETVTMCTLVDHAYGALLRAYRRRAHLTQCKLATLAVVARGTIFNIELGLVGKPRRDVHDQLMGALAPFLTRDELDQLEDAYRVARRRRGVRAAMAPSAARGAESS